MPANGAEGRIAAAVDLGSTSVHLLVGRVRDHRVEPIADESAFLGLGDAVTRGLLGGEGRGSLVDALAHYAWVARESGAETVTFVGTEPMRRLADAARIVDEVTHATGAGVNVLGHEEEGFLTLIGVTEGRSVERPLLVVDIGGGSSEFVTVGPRVPAVALGLRVGAVGLTSRHIAHDPPTAAEIDALRGAATDAIASAPDAAPDEIVVVGGTGSNLIKLVPASRAGATAALGRPDLAAAMARVARLPAAAIAEAYGVRPIRAAILGAGAALVGAILDRYGHDAVRVADRGIREGTILATLHAGPGWRDRLGELARGWAD